jgi:site-specific DNA recombinase
MKAAIYCRVSTDEQAKHGFSLEAQQESGMSYIKSFNHELFKVYVDDGYTAKNMNRPALQEMLDDIRNKRIDIIILWRLDRLTRKARDGLEMVDEIFNKYGVSFATITERHDLTTAQGRWMFTVSLANAQNERELIGERVTMGQEKKAQKGFRVSLGAIYGYDKVNGKLELNENEAPVVNRIFESYVFKGWGYGRIAAALNSEMIPAKKTSWQPVTIKGILKNITYIGKNAWTPRNGQAVVNDGEHVGIVTEELYYLAQTQLKRRGSGEMSRSSYNYPFSTIIKCGACGGSYNAYNKVRRRNDKKEYTNYRCANRKAGICKAPDIAELKLEKLFFSYFTQVVTISGDNYTPAPSPEEIKTVEKEKSRITKEITKLEKRKNNLLDDLGDKIITREDYKAKVDEINLSLSKLREEMDIIEPQEVAVTRSSDEVLELVRNLESRWMDINNEDRKFMVQLLFKRIVINKGTTWSIMEVDPT